MRRLDAPTGFEAAVSRPLRREELDDVLDWAASEGWNPGLDDGDAFWPADPGAYLGVEMDGELIASGATVSYHRRLGYLGLFIVRPQLRGRGLGERLWSLLCVVMRARLERTRRSGSTAYSRCSVSTSRAASSSRIETCAWPAIPAALSPIARCNA